MSDRRALSLRMAVGIGGRRFGASMSTPSVAHGGFIGRRGFGGPPGGDPSRTWQAEHERGRPAPPVSSDEHLVLVYVTGKEALAARAATLDPADAAGISLNNPDGSRCRAAFADSDGCRVGLPLQAG